MVIDINMPNPTEENVEKLYDILRSTPFKKLVLENEKWRWEAELINISYGKGEYACKTWKYGKPDWTSSLTTASALSLYFGVCVENQGSTVGKIYY